MGNAASQELSPAERGRRPTDTEMLVLFKMQRALFRRLVASPDHLQLLQRYWTASFRRRPQMPAFVLVSPLWQETGFMDPNPAADLNPTGELGLQCLVYFVETYPAETAMMRRGRGGYPFAQAAVAIVRSLSVKLHLMDETGAPGAFPVTDALFWQLFEDDAGFYQLFALVFLTFEEHFCEEVARNPWMRDVDVCSTAVVDKLVAAVELRLTTALKRAPLKLGDIQDLCSNGVHVVDRTGGAKELGASRLSTGSDHNSVSRWSQHHTPSRKSMREVGESWGKEKKAAASDDHKESYRLKPRMPEIERPTSDSSQGSSDGASPRQDPGDVVDEQEHRASESDHAAIEDLFAGLVTKTSSPLSASQRKEVAEVAAPSPLARSC